MSNICHILDPWSLLKRAATGMFAIGIALSGLASPIRTAILRGPATLTSPKQPLHPPDHL
jgi:hypothetical protein